MFIAIEELKPQELERLRKMFGQRLTTSPNAHFFICINEIKEALERNLNINELKNFMSSDNMPIDLSIMATDLYDNYSTIQFDELAEFANIIVNKWSDDFYE